MALDNVTGDIYAFDSATNKFIPVANIGMHHYKTAQEVDS